jgi:hypothetical protein
MRLVSIEWLDSHGSLDGWQILDDKELCHEPLKCHSVGWLLYDGDDCKTIIPHLAGKNNKHIPLQGRGDLTIPTNAILNFSELEEKS